MRLRPHGGLGFPESVAEALQAESRLFATNSAPPVPGVTRIHPLCPKCPKDHLVESKWAPKRHRGRGIALASGSGVSRPEAFAEAHEAACAATQRHRRGTATAARERALIKGPE